MQAAFGRFAHWVGNAAGHPVAFLAALALIIVWAAVGPLFGWSDTHQLVINTTTTIITFLLVFIIQATQNRDTRALQVKLDELIRVNERARNDLVGIEKRDDAS